MYRLPDKSCVYVVTSMRKRVDRSIRSLSRSILPGRYSRTSPFIDIPHFCGEELAIELSTESLYRDQISSRTASETYTLPMNLSHTRR